MSLPGVDPRLLEVLGRASSLELFQLSAVIERMLADPKRRPGRAQGPAPGPSGALPGLA
ncbi:hypothetical protein [Rhodanobacter lindaniclasticus]